MSIGTITERIKNKVRAFLSEANPQDENELVTIATFMPQMTPRAQFLQTMLEAEGIICIMNGQWHTKADFVRLQVKKSDAARALERLAAVE